MSDSIKELSQASTSLTSHFIRSGPCFLFHGKMPGSLFMATLIRQPNQTLFNILHNRRPSKHCACTKSKHQFSSPSNINQVTQKILCTYRVLITPILWWRIVIPIPRWYRIPCKPSATIYSPYSQPSSISECCLPCVIQGNLMLLFICIQNLYFGWTLVSLRKEETFLLWNVIACPCLPAQLPQ